MRKRWLGLLLGLLVLGTAPGCRVLAGAGLFAGAVALDYAADRYGNDGGCDSANPPCDRHAAETPMYRCR